MRISKEAYFSALTSDFCVPDFPESLIRHHSDLFARYIDVELTCSLLHKADNNVLMRASALSKLEIAPASADSVYNLQSVFCRLDVNKHEDTLEKYYPCCPLSLTALFPNSPCQRLTDNILDPLNQELEAVAQNPPKSSDDFFILLDTLFKKHLWAVPAGRGTGIDISLYDKMRASAAIAVCLEQTDNESEPFLLLAADFSGIQNYIFTVARTSVKGVSKRLRARSFLVDVMIQSLAYQICEKQRRTKHSAPSW